MPSPDIDIIINTLDFPTLVKKYTVTSDKGHNNYCYRIHLTFIQRTLFVVPNVAYNTFVKVDSLFKRTKNLVPIRPLILEVPLYTRLVGIIFGGWFTCSSNLNDAIIFLVIGKFKFGGLFQSTNIFDYRPIAADVTRPHPPISDAMLLAAVAHQNAILREQLAQTARLLAALLHFTRLGSPTWRIATAVAMNKRRGNDVIARGLYVTCVYSLHDYNNYYLTPMTVC